MGKRMESHLSQQGIEHFRWKVIIEEDLERIEELGWKWTGVLLVPISDPVLFSQAFTCF